MRKLAITLALSTTLALAASATGAHPTMGPFAGKTSLRNINGFPDLVTFVAASGGLALKKFSFGTLGCFGTGSFPVGVDPYGMPAAIGTVAKIPVTTKGTFTVTTIPKFSETDGIVTSATITGTFASAKSVSGTITVSQKNGPDSCGPTKMKFTAVPGTPDSLGFVGP